MIVNDDKKDKIQEIQVRLKKCKNELESMKDELYQYDYIKVRNALTAAISGCSRAQKELNDLKPLEGQMSLFEMMVKEEEEKDL